MGARVDTSALMVRDGALEIPFAVDCGAGKATLDPAGTPRSVRSMRWSEKCALARFAGAGPAFVERQFLAICAGAGADDPSRREAVAALALWLHGCDAPPLPLDPELLGEVTIGLCATLGIGPAELGALPAPEVEAMWQAATAQGQGAGTAPAAAVDDGVTRILVEPDPVESDGSDAPAAETSPSSVSVPPAAAKAGSSHAAVDALGLTLGRTRAANAAHTLAPALAPTSAPPAAIGDALSASRPSSDAGPASPPTGAALPAAAPVERGFESGADDAAAPRGARSPAGEATGRPPPARAPAQGNWSRAAPARRHRLAPRFRVLADEGPGVAAATRHASVPGGSPEASAPGRTIFDRADAPSSPLAAAPAPADARLGPVVAPAAQALLAAPVSKAPTRPGAGVESPGTPASDPRAPVPDRPQVSAAAEPRPTAPETLGAPVGVACRAPAPVQPRPSAASPPRPRVPAPDRRAAATGGVPPAAYLTPASPAGPSAEPAVAARVGALIDIVTRGAKTPLASEPAADDLADAFADRLADAVAGLGLSGLD